MPRSSAPTKSYCCGHLCDLALCLKDEMRCWAAPAGVAALNEGHDASDRCEQGPFIK